MLRPSLSAFAMLFVSTAASAIPFERPTTFDEVIARQAKLHGVPEHLVHRTILRESHYNPHLVHHHCFGLMQIKYRTARSMGYQGEPAGLLDPITNLTYAIPYLANAYHLADGNEDRATALYRGGYYYFAKRRHMQGHLRTASSDAEQASQTTEVPAQPAPSPINQLLSLFGNQPSETAPAVGIEEAQNQPAPIPNGQ